MTVFYDDESVEALSVFVNKWEGRSSPDFR